MAEFTIDGDWLSWIDLMQIGALDRSVPAPGKRRATQAPVLFVPESVREAAALSSSVQLLDPEGVTLAALTVEQWGIDVSDRGWLAGTVKLQSGFTHLDNLDWRISPSDISDKWVNPVIAVWGDTPASLHFRTDAQQLALVQNAHILEVVPVPTGAETSRIGQLAPRLARRESTRAASDAAVVVPAPTLTWDATDILVRAAIMASYGATALAVPLRYLDAVQDQGRLHATAHELGIALVGIADVPPGQTLPSLDSGAADGIPSWFAEPALAAEIEKLYRPRKTSGFAVMLTGLSGSGKSTVARGLAIRLLQSDPRSVSLLDGDVVRHHLSKGLGFSRSDRDTNVRRIGFVASEISAAGGIAICCPIAPYDKTRKDVRAMIEERAGFSLVHVATPLEECERRDRKGLYAKARRGEIPEFTGISDPYEEPTDADIVIDTTGRSIDSCVDDVVAGLVEAGYLDRRTYR